MNTYDQRRQVVHSQVNAENIHIHLPPSNKIVGENHYELINRAEFLLQDKAFDSAYGTLKDIPDNSPLAGRANLLRAIALIAGRSFNAIRAPTERTRIEKFLTLARRKAGEELISLMLLAILEVEYYNYNGQASDNDISPEIVSHRLKNEQLSEKDIELLGLLKIGNEAKNQLGLH